MISIQESYLYERPFRLCILSACLQREWFAAVGNRIIKPSYFNTQEERDFMQFLFKFYNEYKRAPNLIEAKAEFIKANELMADLLIEVYDETTTEDLDYAKKKAKEFAALQTMGTALAQALTLYDKGKIEDILPIIMDAERLVHDEDLGIDLVEDIDKWMIQAAESEYDCISTGIEHLDKEMRGGLPRGKYGLLLAPTNGGKTTTLINFGYGAASLGSRANVLHISINEISAQEVAIAYANRITGLPFDEHKHDLDTYVDKFDNSVNLRLRGRVRIKEFSRLSIEELKLYLDWLVQTGFRPDVLILDYADLITVDPRQEYRFELGRIARELRAIAIDYNMAVWSASQVQRGAGKSELIHLDAIGESYLKATVADIIISINMSAEEKDQGVSRLFCSKTRIPHTKANWIVKLAHDIISGMLQSTKSMSYSEWLELKVENSTKQLQIIK